MSRLGHPHCLFDIGVPLTFGTIVDDGSCVAKRLQKFIGLVEVISIARWGVGESEGDDADVVLSAAVHRLNAHKVVLQEPRSISRSASDGAVVGPVGEEIAAQSMT